MVYDRRVTCAETTDTSNYQRMGEHFLSEKYALSMSLLSVFMVIWSQNEPSESRERDTQLTSALRRVMTMPFLLQIGSI